MPETITFWPRNCPRPVLVDAADLSRVGAHGWFYDPSNGYVRRSSPRKEYLHRLIAGAGFGDKVQVDHVNRNRLDDRRSNLRVATHAENCQNRGSYVDGTSQYRGVRLTDYGWVAQGSFGNKTHYLGSFDNELDAAATAAKWRAENHPGTVEDPKLLAHRPGPRKKNRPLTTVTEATAIHFARATTTLSYREIGEMFALPGMTATNVALQRSLPKLLPQMKAVGAALEEILA